MNPNSGTAVGASFRGILFPLEEVTTGQGGRLIRTVIRKTLFGAITRLFFPADIFAF